VSQLLTALKILTFMGALIQSLVAFSPEILAKLESAQTTLAKYIDLIEVEQLQIDRGMFAINRSLEHKIKVLEKNGKYLSQAGQESARKKIEEFESWCEESKNKLENLFKTFDEVTMEIVALLKNNSLLAKKNFKNFALISEQKPSFVEASANLEMGVTPPAAEALIVQVAQLVQQEKTLDKLEQISNQVAQLDAELAEEQEQLKNVQRRLSINPKSQIIAQKIAQAQTHINTLKEERDLLIRSMGDEKTDPTSLALARANLLQARELLQGQIKENSLLKKGHAAKPVDKPKSPKLIREEITIVANLNKLLEQAAKGRAKAGKMQGSIKTALEKVSKVKGLLENKHHPFF
jgi:hypothetical protein